MTLLSDTPPSATSNPHDVDPPALVEIGSRPSTMDRPAASAGVLPVMSLALPDGVMASTLSERGAKLASVAPAVNEKTRQSPMLMVQRLKLMEAIRSAPADEPDSELAGRLSLQVGRAIASATIKAYRQQLGLVSVASLTKAALRARLAELRAELQAVQQPSLPGL